VLSKIIKHFLKKRKKKKGKTNNNNKKIIQKNNFARIMLTQHILQFVQGIGSALQALAFLSYR
jgi:hypothetical protein